MFDSLEIIIAETAAMVRPPERLTVAEAAEKYRTMNIPGAYQGPYLNETVPYMVEPMECLTSHEFTAMAFVGPAQCAKTEGALNWVSYTAMCDPSDMMLIQTSQATARDFSKRRLDRLYRHSKIIGEQLIPGRNNQNIYDTRFKSGWMLTLSWPTINELSGKPIPRLWLTDYDRMPQDIDGEGSPFDLARKRTTTFRSFGMTVAESSPGFEVENSNWIGKSPHEAPPTKGILSIYNRGDRRRWYWKCVECKLPFEPSFGLIVYPDTADDMEAAEQAVMACPHCGAIYEHEKSPKNKLPSKYEMNHLHSKWIKDGMTWNKAGSVMGQPIRSDIASFWLKGPAAAFQDWKTLVLNYRKALRDYENTGDQGSLKVTVNTDQGEPYVPRGVDGSRLPEDLKNRAEDLVEKHVPEGVRFLIATIDIQKNRFVVQVHGFGEGKDIWIVDRFEIRKSNRLDEDGEHYWISPGSHPEDWHLLIEGVLRKTYPLADNSGRQMMIKLTACDSGGREGVTTNAYEFYRHLRDKVEGNLHRRFQLVKGSPLKSAPRVHISYPDTDRKDRRAGARGEVPVLFLNSDLIKDAVNKMLDRTDPNGGKVTFPNWLPDSFYTELTAEIRTPKGWENPKNHRNESWDLLCYAFAASISSHIRIEQIDWGKPPSWACEWEKNDLILTDENAGFTGTAKSAYSLKSLASKLA